MDQAKRNSIDMRAKNPLSSKIKTPSEFLKIKNALLKNKKIVFTNGCFDILHRGHVEYLEEASSLGDILVVGLNSDASVKRLKGRFRPINKEEDRAIVLAALRAVDFVIIFEEETPLNLITAIKPDILVKGGDWRIEEIAGSDIIISKGGRVHLAEFLKGYSTTKTINTILTIYRNKKGEPIMRLKKILCAVDFAEHSSYIAEYAKTLGEAFDSEIHTIYVAPTLSQYIGFQISPSSIENFVGEIISGAEETMEKFIKENFGTNPKVEGKILTGDASEEIIKYAKKEKIDLIIMGTHGRKGIDRILFGSVAEKVVKGSYIPVLTIRPRKKDDSN